MIASLSQKGACGYPTHSKAMGGHQRAAIKASQCTVLHHAYDIKPQRLHNNLLAICMFLVNCSKSLMGCNYQQQLSSYSLDCDCIFMAAYAEL